jgi:iron(III) transport system substrate-binding protein
VARSNAVGVTRRAPHPNAALLFYEYMLGEGQHSLAKMDYVPSNTKAPSPLKKVKIVQTDPIRALDESEKWTKLFEEVVLKGRGN